MDWPNLLLLAASFSFLLLQTKVGNKQVNHFLFAAFCASMCMLSLQNLSANALGAYSYLIGLGACATCNMVWLIARGLFRTQNAIGWQHIAVALSIALLIMLNKTNALLSGLDMSARPLLLLQNGMNEILNLLSSTVLMLSIWEAFRAYKQKSQAEKTQSHIFVGAFSMGIFNCTVLPSFFEPSLSQTMMPYLVTISAIGIMLSIQIVLYMQQHLNKPSSLRPLAQNPAKLLQSENHCKLNTEDSGLDKKSISLIDDLIFKGKYYLKPNLKMLDIAKAVDMPEYKVSRIIRQHYHAPNFNRFINDLRIEHAKTLIRSSEGAQWSLLVVSLESGFSSLPTFNRAFKSYVGQLPSEFKQRATQSSKRVVRDNVELAR